MRQSLPIAILTAFLAPSISSADGGMVRLSERAGPYQVTVFTDPTPFRAGPVDVSVLVQDPASGNPVADVAVLVHLKPPGEEVSLLEQPATAEAATNKLLHAAVFELPSAGPWQVEVDIRGPAGPARVGFGAEALGPVPAWTSMGFWVGLPALVVGLFIVHQILARRQAARTR
jgi:hypothetical protein